MDFDDFRGTGLGQLWKMPKKKKEKSLKTKYRFMIFIIRSMENEPIPRMDFKSL